MAVTEHTRRPSARLNALWACLLAPIVLVAGLGTSARAELAVCNTTPSRIGLAIGYRAQQGWTTEGWWNVPAQTCETLLRAPLSRRYIYVYAIDYERGGEWIGEHSMCIDQKSFLIRDVTDCATRGHRRAQFFEIDTGEATKWTVRLSDPDKTASKSQ